MAHTYPDRLDNDNDAKTSIPSGINVLTILTFIGSTIGFLYLVFLPKLNGFFLEMMDKQTASGRDISARELADIENGKAVIEMVDENIIAVMASGIVGIILCVLGAIMMRKLKKDGYWLYIAGELLPLIASFIILGTAQFTGVMSVIFAVGLPLLFVALYTMQLKFMRR